MLYVHKKSATPIDPWPFLRHAGGNNLGDESVTAKYLVLFNVDIVQREGVWHYLFEFDTRESLELSALAQLSGTQERYPDDMDWKNWLGEHTIISAAVRDEILHMPASEAHTGAIITNMRPMKYPGQPIPGQDQRHWWRGEIPEDFLIALPRGI